MTKWYSLNLLKLHPKPWMVLLIVGFELFNLAMVAPVTPEYFYDFFDQSLSETSLYTGLFSSFAAFIAFFVVPYLGSLSDAHGRQPFLLLSLISVGVSVWILASGISLWFYFGCQFFGAISIFGLTNAYLADITTTATRTKYYGYVMSTIYLSLIIGAVPGLFLSRQSVFDLASLVAVLVVLYAWAVLPESLDYRGTNYAVIAEVHPEAIDSTPLPGEVNNNADGKLLDVASEDIISYRSLNNEPSRKSSASQQRHQQGDEAAPAEPQSLVGPNHYYRDDATAQPLNDAALPLPAVEPMMEGHDVISALKYAFSNKFMRVLSCMAFFASLGETAMLNTITLYLSQVLHFSKSDLSIMIIVLGVSALTTMLVTFMPLIRKFGERRVVMISIVVNCIRMACFALAREKWQVYLLECFSGFGLMTFAAASSLASKKTAVGEQGKAQGALAGVRQLTSGIGPVIFGGIFSYFVSSNAPVYFPQSFFLLGCLCMATSFAFAWHIPDTPDAVGTPLLSAQPDGLEPPRIHRSESSDASISALTGGTKMTEQV